MKPKFLKNALILVRIIFILVVISAPFINIYGEQINYKNTPGILHVHSRFCEGQLTLEEIAQTAKQKGIKVIIFAEHILKRWEYGIWPFRNLIKKSLEYNSIIKCGLANYQAAIKNLQVTNSELVIINALEASPFYYWKGAPFTKSFGIYDWHKRFLVIGLEKPKQLNMMPMVSNRYFRLNYVFKGILKLWWAILLVVLGFFLTRYGQFKKLGLISIILGIIFFINGFDFNTSRYDQYHGDKGIRPYQDFITYINKSNAMCFWVNPDMAYYASDYGIDITTQAHPEMLQLTDGYTGFSVSFLNLLELVEPESKWDSVLLDYCEGKRNKPVWVIGELGYDEPTRPIDFVQTVFLLSKFDKQSVLDALKNGNMYVEFKTGESKFNFVEFTIKDTATGKSAHIGERLDCQGKPEILISCINPDYAFSETKIDLIKNGQLIKTFDFNNEEIDIKYADVKPSDKKKCYYRLKISTSGRLIYTNPIFVNFTK